MGITTTIIITINAVKQLFLCALVCLFLAACGSDSQWKTDRIASDYSEHHSTRLTFASEDTVHGLDVEFIKSKDSMRAYLNVHSIPIPPHRNDPKKAQVTLDIGDDRHTFEAYRLEGGQRLLLPGALIDSLLQALKEHKNPTLSVRGYRATLSFKHFSEQLEKFEHPFPIENHFHLPF
jgi:hypothetical protein